MTTQTEPRVGCGAAIVVGGRLLLLQRRVDPEAGAWGLPGGKIDLYETTAAATVREIREELGLTIDAVDLLCLVDQIDEGAGTHWLAPVYLISTVEGPPKLCEPAKHAALDWFALHQLPNPLTVPTQAAVRALKARGLF